MAVIIFEFLPLRPLVWSGIVAWAGGGGGRVQYLVNAITLCKLNVSCFTLIGIKIKIFDMLQVDRCVIFLNFQPSPSCEHDNC